MAGLHYPEAKVTDSLEPLLEDPHLHLIAIATPVRTHFPIAKRALEAGKHVLIEKPMCQTSEEAKTLLEIARRQGLQIFVDHTFLFSPSVQKMRQLIDDGELGQLHYIDSVRINLGLFQSDVNVIWDLAVHDLSIFTYLLGGSPQAVAASAHRHVEGQPENLAYLSLFYPDNLIAHLHVNWMAPVKFRRMLIGGSRKMLAFDDMEPSEKLKIYDKGVELVSDEADINALRVQYRSGDMHAPHLNVGEALWTQVCHLVECLRDGVQPVSGGHFGLEVVRQLEAAEMSTRADGKKVELQ